MAIDNSVWSAPWALLRTFASGPLSKGLSHNELRVPSTVLGAENGLCTSYNKAKVAFDACPIVSFAPLCLFQGQAVIFLCRSQSNILLPCTKYSIRLSQGTSMYRPSAVSHITLHPLSWRKVLVSNFRSKVGCPDYYSIPGAVTSTLSLQQRCLSLRSSERGVGSPLEAGLYEKTLRRPQGVGGR